MPTVGLLVLLLLPFAALLVPSSRAQSLTASIPVENAVILAAQLAAASSQSDANNSLTWTAQLLTVTGVDQEVIAARSAASGAMFLAPTNAAWREFFRFLGRATAQEAAQSAADTSVDVLQQAGGAVSDAAGVVRDATLDIVRSVVDAGKDIFNLYPYLSPFSLLAAASAITSTSTQVAQATANTTVGAVEALQATIDSTYSNVSATLSTDQLTPEGRAALADVLRLHLTGKYFVAADLRPVSVPGGSISLPAPSGGANTFPPAHLNLTSVTTLQQIQVHAGKSGGSDGVVFRVAPMDPAAASDSNPFEAYPTVVAAAAVLEDVVADGKLSVQGVDHVLLPPSEGEEEGMEGKGAAAAGGKYSMWLLTMAAWLVVTALL